MKQELDIHPEHLSSSRVSVAVHVAIFSFQCSVFMNCSCPCVFCLFLTMAFLNFLLLMTFDDVLVPADST